MAGERSLSADQFDHALVVLERQVGASPLSFLNRTTYAILNWVSYGLVVIAVPFAAAMMLGSLVQHDASRGKHPVFDALLAAYVLVAYSVGSIAVLVVGGLLLLNLPVIRKLRRQRKLIQKLGLQDVVQAPWELERSKRRVRNEITRFIGPALLVVGLILSVLNHVLFPDGRLPNDDDVVSELLEPSFVWWAMLFAIPSSVLYMLLHRLRRGRDRMTVVSNLLSSMQGRREGMPEVEGPVLVPTREYEQIARMEQAQIAMDRARTIRDFGRRAGSSAHVVVKSRAARDALAAMKPMRRLQIEDVVLALAEDPRPEGVREVDGRLWLHVSDAHAELIYAVNETARRVQILAIEVEVSA